MGAWHTHNVHSSQLGPDLSEHSDHSTVEHGGLEQLEICHVLVLSLEFAQVLNLLHFCDHKRAVGVTFAMNQRQNRVAFFPTIFARQPTGRLGEEKHANKKEDGGNHLDTPRNPEAGSAVVPGVFAADV